MKKIRKGIIIQARTGSTRLPNKILLPFYKELTILDIIILEIKHQFPNTPIILATSNQENDSILETISNKHNTLFYAGDENNVLKRFIDAAESYNINYIVRICADNPFLQAEFISDIFSNIENHDYISYKFDDNTPSILSHIGIFTEGVSLEALKKVLHTTDNPLYLEHVTNYIHGNQSQFDTHFFKIKNYITSNKNIRLTLDTKEDFKLQKELYKIYIDTYGKNINNFLSYIENEESIISRMKSEIKKNSK